MPRLSREKPRPRFNSPSTCVQKGTSCNLFHSKSKEAIRATIIHQRRRSIRVADGSVGGGDGPGDDRGRGIERLSGRNEIQARVERLLQMASDKAGVHWSGDRDSPCASTASSVPKSVGISRLPADNDLDFPP